MPRFDGNTYDHDADHDRLAKQLRRVYRLMSDGEWRTLANISYCTGDHEASVSARLRDLRKEKFGKHTVERRGIGHGTGLFEYRIIVNEDQAIGLGRSA